MLEWSGVVTGKDEERSGNKFSQIAFIDQTRGAQGIAECVQDVCP
jgi:hypothetical protein